MRYVMRIAKPASHQNFERILHFLRGVCLLECLFIPTTNRRVGLCRRSHLLCIMHRMCIRDVTAVVALFFVPDS